MLFHQFYLFLCTTSPSLSLPLPLRSYFFLFPYTSLLLLLSVSVSLISYFLSLSLFSLSFAPSFRLPSLLSFLFHFFSFFRSVCISLSLKCFKFQFAEKSKLRLYFLSPPFSSLSPFPSPIFFK